MQMFLWALVLLNVSQLNKDYCIVNFQWIKFSATILEYNYFHKLALLCQEETKY